MSDKSNEPVLPVLYRCTLYYLGNDCYGEWCVDSTGAVFDRYICCGNTWKQTTYAALLIDRQEQIATLAKDVQAIEAIERKVKERLTNGQNGT